MAIKILKQLVNLRQLQNHGKAGSYGNMQCSGTRQTKTLRWTKMRICIFDQVSEITKRVKNNSIHCLASGSPSRWHIMWSQISIGGLYILLHPFLERSHVPDHYTDLHHDCSKDAVYGPKKSLPESRFYHILFRSPNFPEVPIPPPNARFPAKSITSKNFTTVRVKRYIKTVDQRPTNMSIPVNGAN